MNGQPVCLGDVIVAALQDNEPEQVLKAIRTVGVDIRPEAMGIHWRGMTEAMR